jgi:SPP1 gp7 family putative phage head morphogenesis protein
MFEYSDEAIQRLIDGIYSGSISEYDLPEGLYHAIAKFFEKGLYKGFGMELADATGKDFELLAELRENIYMFSAAKTFQEVKEIGSLMIDENGERRTAQQFNAIGRQTFSQWNDTWGTTEYNTAVGQAQQASKWNEIEANKDVLPMLRYSAVMDANTSEICAPLDGLIAPVDDPIWNTVSPLNHFNCRCVLLQEAGKEGTPDDKKAAAVKEVEDLMQPVFKMNPGKDGYIFKDDHPYFQLEKKDRDFARENFGLPLPKPVKENDDE